MACVYKVYHNYQNLGFWHLKFFSNYKNNSHAHIGEDDSQKSTTPQFYGGGKSLIFSSDKLHPYTLDDMHEQQYQFLQCIKNNNKQTLDPNDKCCRYSEPPINDRLAFVLYEKEDMPKSIHIWLRSLKHETHGKCSHCFAAMMQPIISFKAIPSVLVFEINSRNIKISKTLKFEQEGETVALDIRGLI